MEQAHRSSGTQLVEMAADQPGLSEAEVAGAIASELKIDQMDLREVRVEAEAKTLIPQEWCLEHLLLPIRILPGNKLLVAMADPTDIIRLDDLAFLPGSRSCPPWRYRAVYERKSPRSIRATPTGPHSTST